MGRNAPGSTLPRKPRVYTATLGPGEMSSDTPCALSRCPEWSQHPLLLHVSACLHPGGMGRTAIERAL